MIELFKEHASNYRIVVPKAADEKNRFAADELASYLFKIGGAALPVVTDDVSPIDTELCVGPVGREGLPCTADLKNDGFIMKSVGSRIFLVGHNTRSNLYAAYSFLEDILGCRFFTQSVEHIPLRETLVLSDFDRVKQSPFEYRETSWYGMTLPGFDPKRGFNGAHPHSLDQGAGLTDVFRYLSFGHSMYDYVSPAEYYDTHPEYFSMIDGKRIREHAQLCLTNPEVQAITIRKMKENIKNHPECKVFSLSQMDWYNPCECPECARVDAEEGAHSGTLIRFVNAIADAIAEEFPDVLIDTFAYQFTRQAPKVTRPSPNVSVRICSIECCITHPLRKCDKIMRPFKSATIPGVTFQQDLADWSRIASHLVVWEYTTNFRFYISPVINLHVHQDNIRFFRENHVTGLFEQGDSQSMSGEFGELRGYLLSKLMWDPDGDVDEWMNDFLNGYYGCAAAPIKRYIRLLQDHVERHDVHAGIYESPMDFIPDVLIPPMDALWDEAETLADDDEVLARVQRSRLQVRFIKLHRKDLRDADYAATAESLIADIQRLGNVAVQEGVPLEKSFAQMRDETLPDTWRTFFRW